MVSQNDEYKIWPTRLEQVLPMRLTAILRLLQICGHMPCDMHPMWEDLCLDKAIANRLRSCVVPHEIFALPRNTFTPLDAPFTFCKLRSKAAGSNQSGMIDQEWAFTSDILHNMLLQFRSFSIQTLDMSLHNSTVCSTIYSMRLESATIIRKSENLSSAWFDRFACWIIWAVNGFFTHSPNEKYLGTDCPCHKILCRHN